MPLGAPLYVMGVPMSNLSKVVMSRFTDAKTAINNQLQISSFLHSNGISIESNRQICCPLHDDSTPSFSVNFETNEWKCFGCPDGGHYIDLWMKLTNRRTGTHYTVFTAVEEILRQNQEICTQLGFRSIYQSYENDFDLFKKVDLDAASDLDDFSSSKTAVFAFDTILKEKSEIRYVNTEAVEKIMHKLKNADINKIIEFIADCELGMPDDKLLAKYFHERVVVSDFIERINSSAEDYTNTFLEALADD